MTPLQACAPLHRHHSLCITMRVHARLTDPAYQERSAAGGQRAATLVLGVRLYHLPHDLPALHQPEKRVLSPEPSGCPDGQAVQSQEEP